MRLVPDIAWRTADREARRLDPRLLPLLRGIRERATLRAAVAGIRLSYRSAWDLLGSQTRSLGAPLVVLERGRGARLAPLAVALLAADDEAHRLLEATRERLAVRLEPAAGGALRCIASHDPLLAELAAGAGLRLDLAFRGSMESLAALARNQADLVGFHVPAGGSGACAALLHARRDRLIRFASREQGLMLAPANPKRIRGLGDLVRKRARFLNRQRGSGTRLLIDDLFRDAGIDPASVRGYGQEEFTHVAVAATIASGGADAGVGVRAAAARFGLEFVPLCVERYWLAARRSRLEERDMKAFLDALQGPLLKRIAKRLSGYRVERAGEVLPVAALAKTG